MRSRFNHNTRKITYSIQVLKVIIIAYCVTKRLNITQKTPYFLCSKIIRIHLSKRQYLRWVKLRKTVRRI
ncbi:hypothetical protein HanXRQr2_Chr16g0729301 [Helianthus annuus]|uniref:Uncharacterized protein n=1 Tax=Helianthus annuus TaxID=4232 RepID=A0A9K3DNC0_HELAN|nr:hypothetical protein HanXRQr2_Chr16g0729301 [Helianthus annuus]